MSTVGIIGYGSMGRMLLHGFLSHGALTPPQMWVSTRRAEALASPADQWPGLHVTAENGDVARACDTVFLCVKPSDACAVLSGIAGSFRPGAHLVSIAAGVTLRSLETVYDGPISRVIPSVTSEVGAGVSLVCHSAQVTGTPSRALEGLMTAIGTIQNINEADFGAAADLTSCGPGLIAALFAEFVEASLRHSGLARADAQAMVVETLYATATMLRETRVSFPDLVARVATPGGITQEGVAVLQAEMPGVFDRLFGATLDKHGAVQALTSAQFREHPGRSH